MSAKNYRFLFSEFIRHVEDAFPPGMNHNSLYFAIGSFIMDNEDTRIYNREMLYRLFRDLQKRLSQKRMTMPNPKDMRKVAAAYRPVYTLVHRAALEWLTWEHHLTLVSKVKDPYEQMFYLDLSTRKGWTCRDMLYYIENDLYRKGGYR
jgi:hypothetical protein